jgi:hypothetical protein
MTAMRSHLGFALGLAVSLATGACTNVGSTAPSSGASATPASSAPAASTPAASRSDASAANEPIRIPLSGSAPDGVAIEGGAAWVLAGEGGTLIEVDLAAQREVRSIEVGFGGTHLALVATRAAAVGRFDDSGTGSFLPIVDLRTGTSEGVTTKALGGLTAGDAGIVWALEKAGRLLKIDVASRAVLADVAVGIGSNVHTEVQWGAGSAWVGSDGTPVIRVRGADLTIEATISVDTGLPFLFADGLVWGAGPEQVWAIDPVSNKVVRRLALKDVTEVLALDVDGEDAWLAVRHPGQVGAVVQLDLADGTIRSEVAVSLPAAVRIAPDRVWVASYLTNELVGIPR